VGEEERRGSTLVGPHRDDLAFHVAGFPLQDYGSQGQHKTCLVALKFAEREVLLEQRGEAPQVLLDDLFSDVDAERSSRILERLGSMGQCVITTTDLAHFGQPSYGIQTLYVASGTCTAS
jgi:DNA replication and repair protein RecF